MNGVSAQSGGPRGPATFGWNHTPVDKDNEAISRNYEDVDVELLSPAFMNPETIPADFANGTSGPTDDTQLGAL